ncbi:DUF262 domain-containing protein [Paenibacillus shenyangensis]|uniref:DUF262 domain-containing protein n=1 Tax=Paenibacillus sp. A9 TaxID=1284352 RepID=UPI000362EE00|nr:DUF262 domain-containing protein [Paenibacillus sp. A9]
MYKENYNPIKTMNITMSVSEILNQLKEKIIAFDENLERSLRWTEYKQNLFLDSLMNDYPMPSLFFYEEEYNTYTIIDGIQRLITLYYFSLKDYSYRNALNFQGNTFENLSNYDRQKFLMARIPVTIVAYMENSQDVITDIFYRLNIGGESLNNQELRNRMFAGDMLKEIEMISEHHLWRSMYRGSRKDRYKDYELILKFFTIMDKHSTMYKSNDEIDQFLQYNRFDHNKARKYGQLFLNTLEFIENNLENESITQNGRFSLALYDAFVIPTGLFIRDDIKIYNLRESFSRVSQLVIRGELKGRRTSQRVNIGCKILGGDTYEF